MNQHASLRTRLFRSPLAAAALIGACIVATAALRSPAEPAPVLAAPDKTAVALVDLERLMKNLKEMQALNNQNQAQGLKMQEDLTKLDDQVKALEKDLAEGGAIPPGPSERRNEKTAELFQRRALLKATRDSYHAVFDVRSGNILAVWKEPHDVRRAWAEITGQTQNDESRLFTIYLASNGTITAIK